MADGNYKIVWPTGATAYTDDFRLAASVAKNYDEQQIAVEVYEKTGGSWLQVYPV